MADRFAHWVSIFFRQLYLIHPVFPGFWLVFGFGAGALWAFFSLPLVSWARWHRRKHTLLQLIIGALAGIMMASLVFGWLTR